jgi:hypothetical protein
LLKRALVLASILLLITIMSASELVLRDGRVIEGEEISREGGNFIVTLANGAKMVFPAGIVETVRLIGNRPDPQGPHDLNFTEPETLVGPDVRPPTTQEQLAVFGEPARFQENIIDPTWRPESDWDMDPANNNFNKSKWAEDIIDPHWEPESALDSEDAMANSRSDWQKSIIDSTWTPTDGFSK